MVDYEEHRRHMIAEMSAFIEWGLAHPDKVRWIPRKRIGTGGFSRTMSRLFWHGVFRSMPPAPKDVLRRFLRWVNLG
jgi:hypothetical protein